MAFPTPEEWLAQKEEEEKEKFRGPEEWLARQENQEEPTAPIEQPKPTMQQMNNTAAGKGSSFTSSTATAASSLDEEPSFFDGPAALYPAKILVNLLRSKSTEEKEDAVKVAVGTALGTAKLGYDILDIAQSIFTEDEWGGEAFSKFVRDKSLAVGLDKSTVDKVLDEEGNVKDTTTAYGAALDVGSYFAGYAGLRKSLGAAATKKGEVFKATLAAAGVTQILDDPSNTLANELADALGDSETFDDGLLITFAEALASEDDDSIAMQRFKLLAQEPLFLALGFGATKTLQSANWAANQSRKLYNKDLGNLTETEKQGLTLSFLDEAKKNAQLNQDAPLKIRVKGIKEEEDVPVPKELKGIFSLTLAYLSQQGKRIFSSKGQFTKNTFEAKKHAEVAQRQATSRAEFVASSLQRSLDNIVDGTESAEVVERVQKSLNSNTSFLDVLEPEDRVQAFADEFNLPLDVSENVLKARELLDEMTGKFSNVSIPKEVREAMGNNIGQYLRRSYRLFEDPNYQPPALLEKKAFDYFNNININRGMSVEKAADEALKTVKSLITRNEKAPNDHFERLTKLNRAMFNARKTDEELPEVIREFMGEIKDPVESVLISITKASKFYENLKFYETFNNLGKKGGYVFTNRTLPKSGDSTQTRKFQEQNFVLIENTNSVLDGKYTTKDMYSALMQREEHFANIAENKIYQKFLTGKGMTQAAKTVGSISTHVRNVSGGAQIALANGILPFGSDADAIKIIYAGVRKQGDEALVAKYDEYLGLGIINTSVKMNEFRKLIAAGFDGDYRGAAQRIEDAAKASEPQLTGAIDKALNKAQGALGEGAGKIIESPVGRLTDKIVEGAEEIYMGVDDFYKIHAYEKELSYLRKAFPDAPEETLRQEAADLIKSTFPTYDRVPPGIKAIRELPLGNFVAYPAEIVRTSGNILRRASKEITSGNTVLRNRGLQRLAGFSVSAGAYSGAAYQGAAALGWTEEQREGAEVLAETPWSKYSTRIFTSLNDELVSIDTQFLDSYSTVKEPLFAFVGEIKEGTLRGDGLDKKIFEASKGSLQTLLSPYFSESMLTTVIADVGYAALSEDGRGRKGERYFTQEQDMLDRSESCFFRCFKNFCPRYFYYGLQYWRGCSMEIPKKGW